SSDGARPRNVRRRSPGGERRCDGRSRRGRDHRRREADAREPALNARRAHGRAPRGDGQSVCGGWTPRRRVAGAGRSQRSRGRMKVHLMGIGGAGVSALARVLMARGDEVSRRDVKEASSTAELEDAGARIEIGHDPEHVLFQDLLVYSGAIKSSPELDAARAMGVRVLTRAEMLAELIAERDSIAVGGSAGKTTV